MILTVTPNSALDRVMFIDEMRLGTAMRAAKMIHSVGGKGCDSSVALRTFEVDTLALTFVAGPHGQLLVKLLDSYGIRHDLIWLEGDTRIVHVLVETEQQRTSLVTAGSLPVPAAAFAELRQRYQTYLSQADWVIAAGSLAPGLPISFYQNINEAAHAAQVPILVDAFGPPVRAALAAPPTILKMNRTEFGQTFDLAAATLAELQIQAQRVREREKLPALVLTCGEDGLLAFTREGVFQAVSPLQQPVNTAGAGDTASAMLVWRFSLGAGWPDALRWAAAASAACVLTEGTADSRREDVERILPEVEIRPLTAECEASPWDR
jgi:1-phosphofructokinase family hexose kinase